MDHKVSVPYQLWEDEKVEEQHEEGDGEHTLHVLVYGAGTGTGTPRENW